MKLFDTLAERYRRHRAVHKYDRWLRFWLLDTAIFLFKLALIAGVVLSIYHYTPLVPDAVRQYVMGWQAEPKQSEVAQTRTASASENTTVTLARTSTDSHDMPDRKVIPASLTPDTDNNTLPVLQLVTVAVSLANLRERATTDSNILGQLRNGTKVTLFGMSGRWANVATNDDSGISGYVHVSLLEENESRLRQQFASP